MDEAQHFSNLCTNKKEYGVVEHLDTCNVRRGGREGEGREREREGRGGRENGRVEEDKWVRSVRVRGEVGKGRGGVEWKERGGKGRVEDERLRRGRGRKGRGGVVWRWGGREGVFFRPEIFALQSMRSRCERGEGGA